MSSWEKFSNAPITEALLDIRADVAEGVTLAELATLKDARYSDLREQQSWEGMLQLGPGTAVEMRQRFAGLSGYSFKSTDGSQILQARLDGFTFHRLRPYVSWEVLRDEAILQWGRYRKIAKPRAVARIALRYINRIEMPLTVRDFKEYVRTVPEIAPRLPQALAGFLMRLIVPMDQFGCTAIVTETIEAPTEACLPFILDIDTFVLRTFDPVDQSIWEVFERLRECKNAIFFETVTENAKELFR